MLEKKKGKRTENSERREKIRKLISDYGIETLSDIKDAIKDLLGETIKEMMEQERRKLEVNGCFIITIHYI